MVTLGTNYYAKINPCSECGRPEKRIHLTKLSMGWKPMIKRHRDHEGNIIYYSGFEEFKEFLRRDNIAVEDEYHEEIDPEELIEKIEKKHENDDNQFHDGYGFDNYCKINGYEFSEGNWT